MRWIGLGTIVLAALALSAILGPAAHADPYKWCAVYGGRDGGGGDQLRLRHPQAVHGHHQRHRRLVRAQSVL